MFFQNHRLHRRRHLQQQREKIELPDRGFQIMSSRGEDEKVKDSVFARMEEIMMRQGWPLQDLCVERS